MSTLETADRQPGVAALTFGICAFALNDRLRKCSWSLLAIATWLATLALAVMGGAITISSFNPQMVPWGGRFESPGQRARLAGIGVFVTALMALASAFTWTAPEPVTEVDKDGNKVVHTSPPCDPYMSRFPLVLDQLIGTCCHSHETNRS